MKRWTWLLPRIGIVLLAYAAIHYGVERALQRKLVRTGEAYIGAPVDVGDVRTSLTGLTIKLTHVAASHPNRPNENLVQWEEGVFHLDAAAALRRRFVVRDGRITGLKFNQPRSDDGPLIEVDTAQPQVALPTAKWSGIDQISAALSTPVLEELTALKLAREVGTRWPGPWEALAEASADVAQETAAIKLAMDQARRYPLKGPHDWRKMAADTERLTEAMAELAPRLEKLQQQAESDKAALTAAWKADQQKLKQGLHVSPLDPDQLTTLLAGPTNADYVQQALSCVHWLRQQATAPCFGRGCRQTGVDVLLPGLRRGPDFLIESIALAGEVQFAGHTVPWQGTACGVTTQPQAYGRPAVLRLLAGEPCPLTLEGVFDHTGEIAHDRVALDCPLVSIGERTLGNTEQFSITVAPGNAQVRVVVELTGDKLRGEIVRKQENASLQIAQLPEALAEARELLQTAVADVKRLESRVELSGTLERPSWKLKSNLGPQLANGFRDVLQRKLDESRDAVAQDAQQQFTAEVEQLDRWLEEQQTSATAVLQTCSATLIDLQTHVAQRKNRQPPPSTTLER